MVVFGEAEIASYIVLTLLEIFHRNSNTILKTNDSPYFGQNNVSLFIFSVPLMFSDFGPLVGSFCYMVVSARGQVLGQEDLLHHLTEGDGDSMRRKKRKQAAANAESCDESSDEDTSITALDRVDLEDQLIEQKIDLLKKQLEQLEAGILPEFQKRIKKIEQKKVDWLKMINLRYENELQWLERQIGKERAQCELECKERKQELKETMLGDIDEQKKRVDNDVHAMEITQSDGHSLKPISRKINLRRRAADPPPAVDKRRKTSGPNAIVFRLNEEDVDEDLLMLTRFSGNKQLAKRAATQLLQATSAPSSTAPGTTPNGYAHNASSASASAGLFTRQQATIVNGGDNAANGAAGNGADRLFDARIDHAGRKLYYEKRWFNEGQAVFVEAKQPEQSTGNASNARRPGVIASVIGSEVVVKLLGSNQRLKISVRQLNQGKFIIRKRAI